MLSCHLQRAKITIHINVFLADYTFLPLCILTTYNSHFFLHSMLPYKEPYFSYGFHCLKR